MFDGLIKGIVNGLIGIVNVIIEGLVLAVNGLLWLLPNSPFAAPISMMKASIGSEILGYINYFLPVTEMLLILSVWIVAIGVYYALSVVMRWAKAIS